MSPEPNDENEKDLSKIIADGNSEMIVNLVMTEEDANVSSDGSDVECENEYSGYKLLQQDDVPVGDGDEEDSSSEEEQFESCKYNTNADGVKSVATCSENGEVKIDINYKDLHCSGVDDELPLVLSDIKECTAGEPVIAASSEETQIDMSKTHVELVMNAMASVSLPAMNIPEWAKVISEEEWKQTLLNSVQKRSER